MPLQRVNALNGLLLISSKQQVMSLNQKMDCVNALNGLLLISSGHYDNNHIFTGTVSMPSTGFYSFLPQKMMELVNKFAVCQCPQRASTHFFKQKGVLDPCTKRCVNALNGLLLISSHRTQTHR